MASITVFLLDDVLLANDLQVNTHSSQDEDSNSQEDYDNNCGIHPLTLPEVEHICGARVAPHEGESYSLLLAGVKVCLKLLYSDPASPTNFDGLNLSCINKLVQE